MKKTILGAIAVIFVLFLIIGGLFYGGWNIISSGTTVEEPTRTGGVELMGTDDISSANDRDFSLSPDGKWLTYLAEPGNPFEPKYVLYDIQKQEKRAIGLSPRARELAREGSGPLTRAGCWNSDGTRVFLPGSFLFFANTVSRELQWEVNEKADAQESRYYYECPLHSPEVASLIKIIQKSPKEIEIVDARNPQRIFARHETDNPTIDRIAIRDMTASFDSHWITYVLEQYRGSFIAPSRGYILNISLSETPAPRLLTAPVFGPIFWSPDNTTVYASTRLGDERGIYRWKTDEF